MKRILQMPLSPSGTDEARETHAHNQYNIRENGREIKLKKKKKMRRLVEE